MDRNLANSFLSGLFHTNIPHVQVALGAASVDVIVFAKKDEEASAARSLLGGANVNSDIKKREVNMTVVVVGWGLGLQLYTSHIVTSLNQKLFLVPLIRW